MEQSDNKDDTDNLHQHHRHRYPKGIKKKDERMTDLESALWRKLTHIVFKENRPFDYPDFVPEFTINGQKYTISYGTFRNMVSKWVRDERLEVVGYSPQAFYSIKGVKIQKPITADRTGVEPPNLKQLLLQELLQPSRRKYSRRITNHPVYKIIQNLPFEKSALHDIHLRFEVDGIWDVISHDVDLKQNPKSKDIALGRQEINGLDITVTVHHSNTVSIVVGCSYTPVAVDTEGVFRLTEALAAISERFSKLIGQTGEKIGLPKLKIPSYMMWIVTLWHFGSDASIRYVGPKFFASWEVGYNSLIAIYSKVWKTGETRIRKELQESPNKTLAQALNEKLNHTAGLSA